jgi:hypothetical protein
MAASQASQPRVSESKGVASARPLAGTNLFGMKSQPRQDQNYSFPQGSISGPIPSVALS